MLKILFTVRMGQNIRKLKSIFILHLSLFKLCFSPQTCKTQSISFSKKGVAIASGWESEDPGLKPRWLQATFDPGLPKK